MPPNREHLTPTKLPSEEQLRIYMDSLEIESPYRFPETMVRPFNELLSEITKGVIDLRMTTCSEIFRDSSVKTKLYDANSSGSVIQNNTDTLWGRKPSSFKTSWSRIAGGAKEDNYTRISCAAQLSYLDHGWNRVLRAFKDYQNHRLNGALHEAGLVHTKDDPQIREEIALRKKQYPNQRIFVVMGRELADYYDGTRSSGELDGAILVQSPTFSSFSIPDDWHINSWDSAVVAQRQLRTDHSFHYSYELEKIPRWWRIHTWTYMKFGIEADPHRTTVEIIKEGIPEPSRFGMLEI